MLAIGYSSGEMVVLNASTGLVVAEFSTGGGSVVEHSNRLTALTFGRVNHSVFTAGDDNKIVKWSLETKKEVQSYPTVKSSKKHVAAYLLAVSQSDKFLFAAIKTAVKVWTLQADVFDFLWRRRRRNV
jgi:WD40 repeat protein